MDHGELNSGTLQKINGEPRQDAAATGAISGSKASSPTTAITTTSWRDTWPIHPACELVPPTPADELPVLGEDIVKTGHLTAVIVLWQADPESPLQLLDGRSRLDALEMVIGKPVEIAPPSFVCGDLHALNAFRVLDGRSVDPYVYVISANLRRRSLTHEQRQDALIKLIARTPKKSDRQIAKEAGVDHKTIAKARAKGEATGEVSPVEKRIGEDGRVRKQPTPKLSNRAADQDVSPQPAAPKCETAKKVSSDVNRSHEREQRRFEATLVSIHESCESTVDMVLPRKLTRKVAADTITILSRSAKQINELLQRLRSQRRLLEPNPDGGLDVPAPLEAV